MNKDDSSLPADFWRLVERASGEPVSLADAAALAEQLAGNPEAQRIYLEHIQLQADIRLLYRSQQSLEKALFQLDGEFDAKAAQTRQDVEARAEQVAPIRGFSGTAQKVELASQVNPLRGKNVRSRYRYLLGAVGTGLSLAIAIALLTFYSPWRPNETDEVAAGKPSGPVVANNDPMVSQSNRLSPPTQLPKGAREGFVARIVQQSDDLTWGESIEPFDFLLRIKPRQKLMVKTGYVQVEFWSGAKVILHGPTDFTALGKGSGRIISGRLSAQVANGNFRLKTPTAEVVDLGTAFGVTADSRNGTDVVVFEGRVQVHPDTPALGAKSVVDMTKGMAARFRADGTTEVLNTNEATFARTMPSNSTDADRRDEISLIDLIAGGSGTESYLAGSIAPFNGERDFDTENNEWMHMSYEADGEFHRAVSCPMVDGVFIPTANGKYVPIDSVGNTVDLPENSGYAFGTIWARRKESIQNLGSGPEFDFWGFRTLEGIVSKLRTVRHGLVGMHANMGVTFNLQVVQLLHHRQALEFRGAVSNIENFKEWPPEEAPASPKTRFADCRIYVDGDLRYSRLRFRRDDGDERFSIPLKPEDRFLTVIVTDGDGEFRYDHVVLTDPVITLKKE